MQFIQIVFLDFQILRTFRCFYKCSKVFWHFWCNVYKDKQSKNYPPQSTKKQFVRKLFTLLGHFSKNMSKHIFILYSYIQKDTQNPINAPQITIYNTKHTNNTQVHSTNRTFSNRKQIQKCNVLLYYI